MTILLIMTALKILQSGAILIIFLTDIYIFKYKNDLVGKVNRTNIQSQIKIHDKIFCLH